MTNTNFSCEEVAVADYGTIDCSDFTNASFKNTYIKNTKFWYVYQGNKVSANINLKSIKEAKNWKKANYNVQQKKQLNLPIKKAEYSKENIMFIKFFISITLILFVLVTPILIVYCRGNTSYR